MMNVKNVLIGALVALSLTGCGKSIQGNLNVKDAEKFVLTDLDGEEHRLATGAVEVKVSKPLFASARLVLKSYGEEIELEFPEELRNGNTEKFFIPGSRINQRLSLNGFVDTTTTSSPYSGTEGCDIPGCYRRHCDYYGDSYRICHRDPWGHRHCRYERRSYCYDVPCRGQQRVEGTAYTNRMVQLIQFLDGEQMESPVVAEFEGLPSYSTWYSTRPVSSCY